MVNRHVTKPSDFRGLRSFVLLPLGHFVFTNIDKCWLTKFSLGSLYNAVREDVFLDREKLFVCRSATKLPMRAMRGLVGPKHGDDAFAT